MRERKESGLPWIGPIPSDWDVVKFKHIFAPCNERNPGDAVVLSLYRELGIVPKDSRDDNHNVTSLDTSKYRFVRIGDFVVNKMKAWQGSTAVSDYEGIVSPAYYVYEFRDKKTCRKYYHYLLRSKAYAQQFALLSGGIREGQWDLPADALYNIGIPVPSPMEQSRIATFLDERCAKIDEAIARHDALIKKLDDYRKAVITEAVTKGVRGKREMKESGVVWIKEIPSDWTYKPLKAIFTFGKGLSITKANLVEKGFPVISYGQVHAKYNSGVSVCDELIRYVSKDDICESSLVKKNDLIFADTSEDLEGCGNCVYVDTDYPIYGGYHTIVLNSRFEQSNKFIAYLVKTDDWRFQLRRQLTEVKLYSVSQKVLKDTTVILPPLTEQQEIVAYLDEKCAAIDAAKERHSQLMAKLEEYKKSLIYYAVTGKIEC